MSKIDYVFVILHYKNFKDTKECIESIRENVGNKNYKIVVVDNNSNNKEEDIELEKISDKLIILDENIGYAKGNNVGINYSRKYNPKFVVVINNDTIIEQREFLDKIQEVYDETKFDVLGFKIITNDGDSVNPFHAYKNIDEVNKAIKKSKRNLKIYKSKILRKTFEVYHKTKYCLIKRKVPQNGEFQEKNVSLHGCALVFSEKYMNKYEDCFYNKTFLYHEEEFLEQRRQRDNLMFIYDPRIEIIHKEGSALSFSFDDNKYKSLIFRENEIIKSLILLKGVMKNKKE